MDNQQVASVYILTDDSGRFYVGSHRGSMVDYWGSSSDKSFRPENKYIVYTGAECVARLLECNMIRCWWKHTKLVNKVVPHIMDYSCLHNPTSQAKRVLLQGICGIKTITFRKTNQMVDYKRSS